MEAWIHPRQSAYRSQESAADALWTFALELEHALLKGADMMAVMLDYRKCFDLLPQEISLAILQRLGCAAGVLGPLACAFRGLECRFKLGSAVGPAFRRTNGGVQGDALVCIVCCCVVFVWMRLIEEEAHHEEPTLEQSGDVKAAHDPEDEGDHEDGEVHGGFSQFAARDLELETTTAEHPGSLVPSHTAARDVLLGGFAMELTSARERLDAVGESPPPLDGVGSTTPLPPLPQWLLAACSSKSTVDGWGPDGAASCLALLLGLETSGSLVTRDLPAEAKLAAVSGIFCLGPGTWRNPSVSAAAAALTDTYWGRLEEEKEANSANPRMGQHSYGEAGFGTGDEDEISTQAAASLAQDVCEAFSNESFGDKLFARHAAFQLRDGAPARARAAAWLALREGVAFHLLPPMPAVAPRPERGDAYMFLPPGGEKDPEMLELYVQCLETGALDKSLMGTNTGGIPSLSAALALHAATHAVFKDTGVASSATVLRRLLNRPNTGTVLRGIMCTPLTQRRRPAVARAAAAGTRRVSVDGAGSNFGPGFAYRMDPPVNNVEARRSVMLAACGDDSGLRKELRVALMEAIPPPPLSDDDDDE